MAEIFHARFDSGLDGFSAGTRVTTQGSAVLGDVDGALEIGANVTATRDFANITTGRARVDVWFRITDSSFGSANTNTLFYLLANGVSVSSANSIATVGLDRIGSASGTTLQLTYRNTGGSFVLYTGTTNASLPRGNRWIKLGFVVDLAAKTVDYYLDDVLWMKGVAWPNGSAAGLGRVAFASQSSAPAMWFDNIRVEDAWTEGESVLVDHTFVGGSGEIEASTPTTSARDAHAQPWYIAPDTANYGAFTLGGSGATPDASRACFALQRCAADGILETEFQTPSSGTAYMGMLFRFWDYLSVSGAGAGLIRVSGSDNTCILQLPDRSGARQTVQSVSFTPVANTTYTLRLEMRGRVLIGSIKAASMASGSYTTLFTHTVTSSATGGRGMLSEELAGPFVATTVGTSTVRRFRFTGAAQAGEAVRTIGRWKWGVQPGGVREAYYLDSSAPTRNLFMSKGIQHSHRSSADLCGALQQQTIYDSTNVYAVRQTGSNLTEYQYLGTSDSYVTLLRRGPWISDGILPTDTSENFAPDFDLRPSTWASAFLSAINSGSSSSRNDSPYHDWAAHNSGVTLPAGQQSLTAYGSGQEAHVSQVVIADGTVPSAVWDVTSKWEGNGDPISRAVSTQGPNLTAGTAIRVARAFLLRPASALDGATLTAWRDNLASPGTLTFTTGSAKTDAPGDTSATGFNRRHGWHEITCSGGTAEWTLPVASGTRHMPVFRLHGWTNTNTALAINGTPATSGTDYVLDDLGGGVAVLQVLSDRTANTIFALSAPSGTTAQQDFAAAYGVQGSAQADFAAAYNVIAATQRDFAAAFNVINAAQQDFAAAFNVVGTAQQSFAATYSVIAAVERDFSAAFNLINAAQQDFAAAYGVQNAAQADFSATYNVVASVQRDFAAAYGVQSNAQRDFACAFDILGAGTVSADFPAAYQVVGSVQSDFAANYGVLTSATQVFDANYAVLAAAQQDFAAAYALVGAAQQDFAAAYTVVGTVQRDFSASYSIFSGSGGGAGATEIWEGIDLEAGLTPADMLRVILAAVSGRTIGIGTDTERYLSRDGSKTRLTVTFDNAGNRLTSTVDAEQ